MKYIGTRGGEKVSGAKAIMQGLSENGGLFVPEKFPCVSEKEFAEMLDMSYAERAAKIIGKLLDEFNEKELLSVCEEKYASDRAPCAPRRRRLYSRTFPRADVFVQGYCNLAFAVHVQKGGRALRE